MFGAGTGHYVTNCDSDSLGRQTNSRVWSWDGHGAANCDNDNLGGKATQVKFPMNCRVARKPWGSGDVYSPQNLGPPPNPTTCTTQVRVPCVPKELQATLRQEEHIA